MPTAKVSPPHGVQGDTPATYAAALAAWATDGGTPAHLYGALTAGNGRTVNAFLRRLTNDQIAALAAHVREHGQPMPHSTSPYGLWEVRREASRRGMTL